MRLAPTPDEGWIRTIRTALGMSAAQLGKRLGISQQGALDVERREREGTITVAKLRTAAAALNCELKIVFVPEPSLEAAMTRQAMAKARAEQNQVVHTMRLEAQDQGVAEVLDLSKAQEAWMTTRLARLWD